MHKRQPWTIGELHALVALADHGTREVATMLGRSPESVRCKAKQIHISVRRTTKIHDPDLTLAAVERIGATRPEILCPACGARLATIVTSGLCGVCHKQRLIDGHRQRQAEIHEADAERQRQQEIDRAYAREKQAAHRRVICRGCGAIYSPRTDNTGRQSDRGLCPACRQEHSR